jgi:hypothetical protein
MLRITFIALLCAGTQLRASDPLLEFNRDIRPILSDNCFACHGPDSRARKGNLRLDSEEGLQSVIKANSLAKSEFWSRVTSKELTELMPPPKSDKKLSAQQIATLKRWIEQGARYEGHWAFEPIKRPSAPVKGHPIDAYVSVELPSHKLKPSPTADKVTLIRRLSFDLLGLPPSVAEVDAFIKDESPNAYEKLVDRLLKSPHYGERLAVFWLDLVRYADSVGYHGDQSVSTSPFRDWVINAFNSNMPFDRFTREQVAGDLLPNATTEQRIAAGYNRLGMMSAEGGVQPKEYLAKYASERVRNISGAWLGVTIGCAECHDHKFDPFSTKDFYQLQAFFTDFQERGIYGGENFGPYLPVLPAKQEQQLNDLERRITEIKNQKLPNISSIAGSVAIHPKQRELISLETQKQALLKSARQMVAVMPAAPRMIRVLPRGNWMDESGEAVVPDFPKVFGIPPAPKQGRLTRLDLANWLVSKENPLTARTLANRLFKLFYGNGLSRKLDDLGSQGEWPTHPALLDFLAAKLIDSGWDLKAFVKFLVLSETYKQSSLVNAEAMANDPYNHWLGRQSRFRLDAEFVRDNALAVSGLLNRKIGGDSVKPYQPAGYWSYLNFPRREWQNDQGDALYRRGVYTHWQRQYLHPSLAAFDAPSREECTAERVRSNTPLQALVLLNDPIYVEAARAFAEQILARSELKSDEERLHAMMRSAITREARPQELNVLLGLLKQQLQEFQKDPAAAEALLKVGSKPANRSLPFADQAAWTSIARTILNLHATITRN